MTAALRNNKPATALSKPVEQWDPQAGSNSGIVRAAPGTLLRVTWSNIGATPLWLMFFDAATVPSGGAIPMIAPLAMAGTSSGDLNFEDRIMHGALCGVDCATGISWAASTTAATLTIDTSSSTWPTIRYR